MSNLPVFLTGLASGPVIVVAAWMLVRVGWSFTELNLPFVGEVHLGIWGGHRGGVAEVASIRLPGGIVLCWRSTVP